MSDGSIGTATVSEQEPAGGASGAGEMAGLFRSFGWDATTLGAMDGWSPRLRAGATPPRSVRRFAGRGPTGGISTPGATSARSPARAS